MKNLQRTGITRAVDELGRIVFPVEIRRALGWEPKDRVEIFLPNGKGGDIALRKLTDTNTLKSGMTRPVDELGRVVIPKAIRRSHKFETKDMIEIFTFAGGIVIRKIEITCCFCAAKDNLTAVPGTDKQVCPKHLQLISSLEENEAAYAVAE